VCVRSYSHSATHKHQDSLCYRVDDILRTAVEPIILVVNCHWLLNLS